MRTRLFLLILRRCERSRRGCPPRREDAHQPTTVNIDRTQEAGRRLVKRRMPALPTHRNAQSATRSDRAQTEAGVEGPSLRASVEVPYAPYEESILCLSIFSER